VYQLSKGSRLKWDQTVRMYYCKQMLKRKMRKNSLK